ncbi:MAG: hypothetical protein ETSY2_06550 [Candidatus Entotheonella gemina]|uniref:Glyoxalase/fosfomycin resistance/dioxygenase domain-containing protein n=1 Tax=Candidatus Entotheonella gemina TaxID=1429439 RepID=W4MDG3_9BACT|nr:MAG: hypothetical protein ETSY2_06550 [Candidatus Entotheonella gemina]
MSITMGSTASADRATMRRPRRLHHAAWITRDQEATRQFYEDIIGLPLEAAWAERGQPDGSTVIPTQTICGWNSRWITPNWNRSTRIRWPPHMRP